MSRVPSAAHLAARAGLAPAIYESAGKRRPSGTRHGIKWLASTLVEAAGSVGRMKGANYLSTQHARLTARRGMGRAAVAVAHSMLVSAYYILLRRALSGARRGLAGPAQHRGTHPPAGHPAQMPRPHRGPRPGRLTNCRRIGGRASPAPR
jgi:Transposase IS116/IS110/IS902 family